MRRSKIEDRTMSEPNGAPTPETADGQNPEATLAAVQKERDQYLDLFRRTQADFDNYQKRVQRDMQQERRYALFPLAHDLLPVLDNLSRALSAAQQAGDQGPLVQGVAMVQSQLLDVLKRHGITPIEALHQPFDPNLHQAVMQRPANQPPNTVVDVVQQGFKIHDRVLRPASVVVSSPT
jgi:molecular chaperone GrpE